MSAATPMIAIRQLWKQYRVGQQPLNALADINLSIAAGDYLSITGPSGSGKSTLLNMIGLLDRPDRGSYRLNGRATEQLPEEARAALRRKQIGFIFQAFHLIPRLSAYENIALPLLLAGCSAAEQRRRVEQALAQVGLAAQLDQRPDQLSGGQMQRVAIARALVNEPLLILADEPTGALDSTTGQEILALFQRLNARGITIILVTHDSDVAQAARRILRFHDGHLIGDEPVVPAAHPAEANA